MKKHNHITRDIKPEGICPSCDEYHQMCRTKEKLKSLKKFQEMSELDLSNFIYKNNSLVKKYLRQIKRNEKIYDQIRILQEQADHYYEISQDAFDEGYHDKAVKYDSKYTKLDEKIKKLEAKLDLV